MRRRKMSPEERSALGKRLAEARRRAAEKRRAEKPPKPPPPPEVPATLKARSLCLRLSRLAPLLDALPDRVGVRAAVKTVAKGVGQLEGLLASAEGVAADAEAEPTPEAVERLADAEESKSARRREEAARNGKSGGRRGRPAARPADGGGDAVDVLPLRNGAACQQDPGRGAP